MNAQCVLRGKRSGLCARRVAERLRSGVGATERKRRDRPHLPATSCRGAFLTGTARRRRRRGSGIVAVSGRGNGRPAVGGANW